MIHFDMDTFKCRYFSSLVHMIFSDITDMIQAVCAAVNVFVVTILLFYGTFSACFCSNSH